LADGLRSAYKVNVQKGELDLVVGGPPCQGFSGIGHRRSYSVEKRALPSNHLYEDMARVIHRLRPKAFLFENVRGLLTARWRDGGDKGEIWEDVKATFSAIPGYVVRHQLLYAKDYGVPQNRPRILLVGFREDVAPSPVTGKVADGFLPEASGGAPSMHMLLGDLVDETYRNGLAETPRYPERALTRIQKWLRTDPDTGMVRGKGEAVSEQEYSKHREDIVVKFRHMLENNGEIPASMKTAKFAQRVLPREWGEGGPTITATSLPDDYVHYCQPRTLTVREWARLQTFPDYYSFAGKRTTGGIRRAGNPKEGIFDREVPKYTQIGNAVPVLLAKAIGDHFSAILSRG
jgi:DNA (cytosine-5)-methyltransferase 1